MFVIALWAASSCARAQALSDPTRPPSASPAAGQPDAGTGGPRLQSILLSPGRKIAIIDGQTVALGGKIGDATLVRIAEAGVVLKRGDELETLPLLPAAAKKIPLPRRGDKGAKE